MDRGWIRSDDKACIIAAIICALLGMLLLSACATSRRSEIQAHATNHESDSVHVAVSQNSGTQYGVNWQSIVLGTDSATIEVDVTETTFDTSRTDSGGAYPIASVKNTRIRGKKGGERKEEIICGVTQADSVELTYDADSASDAESTENIHEEKKSEKTAGAWRLYAVILALAAIIIYTYKRR